MWKLAFAVVLLVHGAVAEGEEGSCECVPYYKCEDDGTAVIDIRKCDNYLEVCCVPAATGVSDTPASTSYPLVSRKARCGQRNPDGVGFRITGDVDNEAKFGEFPWMVAVMKREADDPPEGGEAYAQALKAYRCGGSLIHPKVVLTGAHCVAGKEIHQLKIRAGEWALQANDELYTFQERDVERIVAHEHFREGNLFNDVALLFLSEPVDPAENIGFVCVPPQGHLPPPGTRCIVTGWGKDQFGTESQSTGILKKIDLPMVANPECQAALRNTTLGRHFKLHESFMCAGGLHGKDSCKGDGGSPLVCPLPDHHDTYIQSGIVAWGIGCGENEVPGVYANVAFFRNWIDGQMNEAQLDSSYYSY